MDQRGVLTAIAAYGLAGSQHELPATPLADDCWQPLLAGARDERVSGLLATAVGDGHFPVTDAQYSQLAEWQNDEAAAALSLERMLLRVDALFRDAGIDYRVLKGPALAHTIYPDPAWRAFGDVDVIVPSDDFDAAVALLESVGARRRTPALRPGFDRRFGKGATILMPEGLELDLHRTFVSGPLGLTVKLEDVFAAETPFTLGGHTLHGLGRDERFVLACYHAALDRPARLSSLRDIAQFVLTAELDVRRAHEVAASWRATAVMARAVNMTWETLALADVTSLSAWAARHVPDPVESRMIDSYIGGDRSYARQAIAALRVIPGITAKVAYARALAFPKRDHLDGRHTGRIAHVRRGTGHLSVSVDGR